MRFRKVNRVFHLQIQQGTLGPHGTVQPSPVSWKPVDDFDVKYSVPGYGHHELDIDNRGIVVGNIINDWGTALVTGVGFRVSNHILRIEVYRHSFNFSTGRLMGHVRENHSLNRMVVFFV